MPMNNQTVAEHIKSLQGRFDRMISILDEGKCDADHAALLGNLLALMVAADLTAIKESLEIFTAACNAQLEQQDAPLRVGFFYTNITETNP